MKNRRHARVMRAKQMPPWCGVRTGCERGQAARGWTSAAFSRFSRGSEGAGRKVNLLRELVNHR
jgi:hypothetical protein